MQIRKRLPPKWKKRRAGRLELVYDFSAIGFAMKNQALQRQLFDKVKPRPQDEDENNGTKSVWRRHRLLQNGDICDAKTIMALQFCSKKSE